MQYLSQHQRDFCVSLVTPQQRLGAQIKLSFHLSLALQSLLFSCLGLRGISTEIIWFTLILYETRRQILFIPFHWRASVHNLGAARFEFAYHIA